MDMITTDEGRRENGGYCCFIVRQSVFLLISVSVMHPFIVYTLIAVQVLSSML